MSEHCLLAWGIPALPPRWSWVHRILSLAHSRCFINICGKKEGRIGGREGKRRRREGKRGSFLLRIGRKGPSWPLLWLKLVEVPLQATASLAHKSSRAPHSLMEQVPMRSLPIPGTAQAGLLDLPASSPFPAPTWPPAVCPGPLRKLTAPYLPSASQAHVATPQSLTKYGWKPGFSTDGLCDPQVSRLTTLCLWFLSMKRRREFSSLLGLSGRVAQCPAQRIPTLHRPALLRWIFFAAGVILRTAGS